MNWSMVIIGVLVFIFVMDHVACKIADALNARLDRVIDELREANQREKGESLLPILHALRSISSTLHVMNKREERKATDGPQTN